MTNLNQQFESIIRDINDAEPPPSPPREVTQVERLSEDLVKTLISGAQDLLTQAQNLLKDDEVFADHLRSEIRQRAERHAEFLGRLNDYRSATLEARKVFQDKADKL